MGSAGGRKPKIVDLFVPVVLICSILQGKQTINTKWIPKIGNAKVRLFFLLIVSSKNICSLSSVDFLHFWSIFGWFGKDRVWVPFSSLHRAMEEFLGLDRGEHMLLCSKQSEDHDWCQHDQLKIQINFFLNFFPYHKRIFFPCIMPLFSGPAQKLKTKRIVIWISSKAKALTVVTSFACWLIVAGVPSWYSMPSSNNCWGMAKTPPFGKYGL